MREMKKGGEGKKNFKLSILTAKSKIDESTCVRTQA